MNQFLLVAIASRIVGQSGAALGLPCRKVSKEVAEIAACAVHERITRGDRLMPDSLVAKAELDMNNPFNEWGLDAFEGADFSWFERTDLINAIKHLVALGYWWKLAASLPDGVPEARHYKEKLRAG